jgi:hypothetical protein
VAHGEVVGRTEITTHGEKVEMKKKLSIFILIIYLLFVSVVFAQPPSPVHWYIVGSTIQWTAVTTLSDGSPIPLADTITYKIYTVKYSLGANSKVLLGTTAGTSYTVNYTGELKFFVGVSCVRQPNGVAETFESEISWSINPGACQGGSTFGLMSFLAPKHTNELHYS